MRGPVESGQYIVARPSASRCRDAGIAQSMGSRGDCFDNAVAESFFATLKKDSVHAPPWPTKGRAAHGDLRVHRGLLQPPPPHSTLGMLSPADYEADHAAGGPDGARARSRARARAENLCTTFGCAQLRQQHQPDSTKPGEVQIGACFKLVRQWLQGGCDGGREVAAHGRRDAAGRRISPLLSNIYLHALDRAFADGRHGRLSAMRTTSSCYVAARPTPKRLVSWLAACWPISGWSCIRTRRRSLTSPTAGRA